MTTNLKTTYCGFSPTLLAQGRIWKRVHRLETLYPRIISCHMVAEESHRQHHNVHSDEDCSVAMRDAFDALEVQLRSYCERQQI